MSYKLTNLNTIIRIADKACIPTDTANRDYTAYLAWLAEGNAPDPVDPPTPPTAAEQIRALEAQYADAQARLSRQSLLVLALDRACNDPAAAGVPRGDVHAFLLTSDPGYAAMYSLEMQVQALRAS
jgi:hypothetical protein